MGFCSKVPFEKDFVPEQFLKEGLSVVVVLRLLLKSNGFSEQICKTMLPGFAFAKELFEKQILED